MILIVMVLRIMILIMMISENDAAVSKIRFLNLTTNFVFLY